MLLLYYFAFSALLAGPLVAHGAAILRTNSSTLSGHSARGPVLRFTGAPSTREFF
ncbi:unnamed protein product, partial [Amoebophrya sp. A25]|eukprot:GSA25T00008898001.1